MGDKKVKQTLDHLLGLDDGQPDKETRALLQEYGKMRDETVLDPAKKEAGWAAILERIDAAKRTAGKESPSGDQVNDKIREISQGGARGVQGVLKKRPNLIQGRPFLAAALAAAVFSALLVSIVFIQTGRSSQATIYMAADTTGAQTKTVGKLRLNGKQISGAKVRIDSGDVIENSEGSYRLILEKEMALDVQFASRLTYRREDGQTVIDLEQGAVAAVIRPRQPADANLAETSGGPDKPRYLFHTPAGDIAVRGTIFYVRVMSEEESYFCICHGSVDLAAGESRQTVSAVHHGGYRFLREDGGKIVTDTMKYHQDPLFHDLSSTLDYTIIWK